ncbi:RmlC-like cupin [Cadophora sp. DSE1049]|nr:RmlC-like cupin [Cadophora sp. DSE1049]
MGTKSRHVFSLLNAKPYHDTDLGNMRRCTAEDLPILKNLSMKRLVLAPGAIREPHWHANCNELAYCIQGKVLVSVLDNGTQFSSFTITEGRMFHISTSALHHIENIGNAEAEFIITFRHEQPKDFSLENAFGVMSDAVLGNTYGLPSKDFAKIPRDHKKEKYIVKREGPPSIPSNAGLLNGHKFDVERMAAPVGAEGVGTAKTARDQLWPALKDISMYVINVEEGGMREPHWHPFTAEMGYVHKGEARMTILDPDGSVDTYTLKPGDCYFVPNAYRHQIEVLSKEDIHFCIFFDQPWPGDIGYKTSATALSPEVLAATFGVKKEDLPDFPVAVKDPLLGKRANPLDPVV